MNLDTRRLSDIDLGFPKPQIAGEHAPEWDRVHAKAVGALGCTPAFSDGAVVAMVSLSETLHAQESAYNDQGILNRFWKKITGQRRKEQRTIIDNRRCQRRATQGVVLELARQQRVGAEAMTKLSMNLVGMERSLKDAARLSRDIAGHLVHLHRDVEHLKAQVEAIIRAGGGWTAQLQQMQWERRVARGRYYQDVRGFGALLLSSYDLHRLYQGRLSALNADPELWDDYLCTCSEHLGLVYDAEHCVSSAEFVTAALESMPNLQRLLLHLSFSKAHEGLLDDTAVSDAPLLSSVALAAQRMVDSEVPPACVDAAHEAVEQCRADFVGERLVARDLAERLVYEWQAVSNAAREAQPHETGTRSGGSGGVSPTRSSAPPLGAPSPAALARVYRGTLGGKKLTLTVDQDKGLVRATVPAGALRWHCDQRQERSGQIRWSSQRVECEGSVFDNAHGLKPFLAELDIVGRRPPLMRLYYQLGGEVVLKLKVEE